MNVIVVLNYNDQETTKKFLDSILEYDSIDKIIVVDNQSSDNSYMELKKYESIKIKVISTQSNKGYGSGNNFGIRYAEEHFSPLNIIISNPDIEVSNNSIKKMIEFLDKTEKAAIVTGLVLDKNSIVTNHYAWKLPTYSNFIINLSITLSKVLNKFNIGNRYSIKNVYESDFLNVDVVQGCFFVVKHAYFKEVGFFDEETFLYHEENIVGFKLKKAGYQTVVLPKEKIIHQHGASIKKTLKSSNSRKKFEFESAMVYLKKYQKISKEQAYIYRVLWRIFRYENYLIERLKAVKDKFISDNNIRRTRSIGVKKKK